MKKLFTILAVLSLSVAAFAQEDGNRDANGKIVRGPYETNNFWDNWGIGVAGGVNFIGDRNVKPGVGGNVEFNVSKYFTPCYGLRFGFQGITARGSADKEYHPLFYTEKDGRYVNRIGLGYIHGDFMWNISNEFWGYRESRVYNCVPYLHAGLLLTGNRNNADSKLKFGKELGAGAGIYNSFKVCKRLDITLDVRGILYNGRAIALPNGVSGEISVSAGLNVNLGKTAAWKRSAGISPKQWKDANDAISDANSALDKAKADAAAKDKALAAKDEELAKAKADAEAARKAAAEKKAVLSDVTPATMYFNIGESELPVKERLHLDYYVKTVIANVDENRTIVITGTADKNTGSASRNRKLAQKRVQYVQDLLVNKYNIAPSRIVAKSEVVKAKSADAPLSRSIVIAL